MKKENEHYLNLRIDNNEREDKEELNISIKSIFLYLKKYFAAWLTLAVVVASLVFSVSSIMKAKEESELEASISFAFDGIEKGRNPNGGDFDAYEIVNPVVIRQTLNDFDIPMKKLESIKRNIKIQGEIPQDIKEKIDGYESIVSQGGSQSLAAYKELKQIEYHSTKFNIYFNYSKAGLAQKDAVNILNGILKNYRQYFFEKYGYNYALGDSLKDFGKYSGDYDYAELLDIYSTAIDSLKTYINNIQVNDSASFRSNATGLSFADISKRLDNLKTIDLDVLASFISVNNITKNKDRLISYYQYRVESLEREKKVWDDQVNTITELISTYERGEVLMVGSGDSPESNINISQPSETYDSMFNKKIDAKRNSSNIVQRIDFYKTRITQLQGSQPNNSKELCDEVQNELNKLNLKINELTDITNDTAEEYYDTITLGDAYKILIPASSSVKGTISIVISKSIMPIIVAEVALFGLYVLMSFIVSLVKCNQKTETESVQTEDESFDDSEPDDSESENENKVIEKKEKTNKRK